MVGISNGDLTGDRFEHMLPFLKRRHDRKHFFIVDFAVDLGWREFPRVIPMPPDGACRRVPRSSRANFF
jgi:hypothetical protein